MINPETNIKGNQTLRVVYIKIQLFDLNDWNAFEATLRSSDPESHLTLTVISIKNILCVLTK